MNSPATKTLQSLSTALWVLASLGAGTTVATAAPVTFSLGKTTETAAATAAPSSRAADPTRTPVTFSLGGTTTRKPPTTDDSVAARPILGTQASTSATTLQESPADLQVIPKDDLELAQATRRRRRRTLRRSKPDENYIGVGLNIGLEGETALGDSETIALFGRVKLARRFSLRPSVVIDDNATISFPATFDIPLSGGGNNLLPKAPVELFVGAGPLFTLDDDGDNEIGVASLAGVDVPFLNRFTASANLIVGFSDDDVDLGTILGIAFRFPRR